MTKLCMGKKKTLNDEIDKYLQRAKRQNQEEKKKEGVDLLEEECHTVDKHPQGCSFFEKGDN